MRIIDADNLDEKAIQFPNTSIWVPIEAIWDATTIDAVPVVRCGECERRNKSADLTDTVYCPWLNLQMRKTDFCSYGEQKDGEINDK